MQIKFADIFLLEQKYYDNKYQISFRPSCIKQVRKSHTLIGCLANFKTIETLIKKHFKHSKTFLVFYKFWSPR